MDHQSLGPSKNLTLGAVVILLLVLLASLVFLWLNTSSSLVSHYVLGKKNILKVDENNRLNILLLGIGGLGHDGPNLTDTIMLVSYNLNNQEADLISLPRDLWLDKYQAKVNALYQIGLNKGEGLKLPQEEIGNILGAEIPYTFRLDFDGFVKAVDLIKGIDILVERSFEDSLYPLDGREADMCGYEEKEIELSDEQAKKLGVLSGRHKVLLDPKGQQVAASPDGLDNINYTDWQVINFFSCRFERLSFKQGLTHMNGAAALKFVRSRHGSGLEGSDFARSKRQQKVLQAFKTKLLSVDTLADPQKLLGLLKTFNSSVDTNITPAEYLEFAKLGKNVSKINSFVIDENGNPPLLTAPKAEDYKGAWVLIPVDGSYAKIHQFVLNIFLGQNNSSESGRLQ